MSVFLRGEIPRISPNIRFLEGINLIEAGDQDITEALREQLGGVPYTISIDSNRTIRYLPQAEGDLQLMFIGRKIALSWRWELGSELLFTTPKFLSGIFYPMNEQNFSICNKRLLERVFTRIGLNALEEAQNHEQQRAQRELQKAYNQGVRIIFTIANNRRYFKSEIIPTWSCSGYKTGYHLVKKIPFIRNEESFTLFELNDKITSILNNGRELLALYAQQPIELGHAQEDYRRDLSETCEREFSEQLTTTLANFLCSSIYTKDNFQMMIRLKI